MEKKNENIHDVILCVPSSITYDGDEFDWALGHADNMRDECENILRYRFCMDTSKEPYVLLDGNEDWKINEHDALNGFLENLQAQGIPFALYDEYVAKDYMAYRPDGKASDIHEAAEAYDKANHPDFYENQYAHKKLAKADENKLFEQYEKEGRARFLYQPEPDMEYAVGQEYKVLGRAFFEPDAKMKKGQVAWEIEVASGETFNAFPDEIIPSAMRSGHIELRDEAIETVPFEKHLAKGKSDLAR